MLNLDVSNRHTTLPQLGATLWHCDQCNAFISIHSAQRLDAAFCPACGGVRLEFCGKLTGMPGIQFGEA